MAVRFLHAYLSFVVEADRSINGKTYLFNDRGNPVYGLQKVRIGSTSEYTSYYFGDKKTSTMQKGKIIEGETDADGSPYTVCYLPVRFTAEALGANVTWDESMHRLVMAFAFYYSDAAIQPIINSKSPYTTKMLESNPTSWSTIASIASSSNAAKKKELITAALNVVNPAYQNEDGGWGRQIPITIY